MEKRTANYTADESATLDRMFTLIEKWTATSAREGAPEVQHGSPLHADDTLLAPHHLSHAAMMSLGASLDHLHALRMLVIDAQALHTYTPFTLCRAALENAAQAAWVLSPPEQPERLRRRLLMAARDARELHEAAKSVPSEDHEKSQASLTRKLERIVGIGEAAGLHRSEILGGVPSWSRIVREAEAPCGTPPGSFEAVWRMCSGYAHGQAWSLLSSSERERTTDSPPIDGVGTFRFTASTPTFIMALGAAIVANREARRLLNMRRLRFV